MELKIFFGNSKNMGGPGEKQRPSGRFRSIRIKEGTFPSPWADEAPSLALRRGGWRRSGGGAQVVEGSHV
jgi:hypothetical protein